MRRPVSYIMFFLKNEQQLQLQMEKTDAGVIEVYQNITEES